MYRRLRPHIHQFSCYIGSGAAAAALDFGSYFLLMWMGVWYVTANIFGNVLGFFGAFLFHKYLVFHQHSGFVNHFVRYCILSLFNVVLQTMLLMLFVERLNIDAGSAKIASWILSALGNFFLYKFFVYV